MTEQQTKPMTTATEYVRQNKIPDVWPNIYSISKWKQLISTGAIPSSRPAGTRTRVVRVADVEAFLGGKAAA